MKLSEKQLTLISQTASQEAIKAYRQDEAKRQIEKQDQRLRNIKLLLQNYRSLSMHCENLKLDLVEFGDTSIHDLDLDEINLESVESIKKSKKESLAMILFIKGKMDAYRRSCTSDELKYFRVLEKKYLTDHKYTTREIAEFENIEERTVRRYLEKAVTDLPVIFFGVKAIKFDK
ncbi:hypothetical protein ACM26V_24740 [Salipaludibacillus sp. HK11]|uniref:hypothetical protein n=1 Tax=Salipaludibacillus sp. HK11 TaxID=3394320 RepID=UPI0039FCBB5E